MSDDKPASTLIARVVKGPHHFDHVDPETGQRYHVAPGEEVRVTKEAAKAFSDTLIDPQVLAAQTKADEVIAEAEAELEDNTAKPKTKPQSSPGPLKASPSGTTGKSSSGSSE